MKTTNERIFANDIKMSYWQQDNCMRCAKAVWYNTQLGRCPKYKCALQRDRRNTERRINQVQCKCTTKALLMRYIVITENPMTGERTTVETKDFESLRIDQSQIVAIVDKSDQQVTYDGETWCSYEKVYNT